MKNKNSRILEEAQRDLTEATNEVFQGRYGATKREYQAIVNVIDALLDVSDAITEGKIVAIHKANLEEEAEPSLIIKTEQLRREYSSLMDTIMRCSFFDYVRRGPTGKST